MRKRAILIALWDKKTSNCRWWAIQGLHPRFARANMRLCVSVSVPAQQMWRRFHDYHTGSAMNKQELIDAVAAGARAKSKAATGQTIDAYSSKPLVTKAVGGGGDTVQLVGFGSSSTGARAARVGRNPSTGAENPDRRSQDGEAPPPARHSRKPSTRRNATRLAPEHPRVAVVRGARCIGREE